MKQPLSSAMSIDKPALSDWIILNKHFVIWFFSGQPYLVDIERLQQDRLLSALTQAVLPLASRPLLVPVSNKMDCQQFLQCHDGLTALGFQLEWQDHGEVLVRTIPQTLPQLDIKKLLHHLALKDGISTIPTLLKLLVRCQSLDAYQFNHDDKTALFEYLQHELQRTDTSLPGCVPLDSEKCRAVLYV